LKEEFRSVSELVPLSPSRLAPAVAWRGLSAAQARGWTLCCSLSTRNLNAVRVPHRSSGLPPSPRRRVPVSP